MSDIITNTIKYDQAVEAIWFNTIDLYKEMIESLGVDLGPTNNVIEYKNFLSGDPIYWVETVYANGGMVGGGVGDLSSDEIVMVSMDMSLTSHRPNRTIKYIAIHYTGGPSSKPGVAKNMPGAWIKRRASGGGTASADFGVDDRDICQFNSDLNNYASNAVGLGSMGRPDKTGGGASFYGIASNSNSVSIEVCSTLNNGDYHHPNHSGWSFTEAVLNNAARLTKFLMQKFGIPISNVIRHWDVTGKMCPGIIGWNNHYIKTTSGSTTNQQNNSQAWEAFKQRIANSTGLSGTTGGGGGGQPSGSLVDIGSELQKAGLLQYVSIVPVYGKSGGNYNCMNQCFPGYKQNQGYLWCGTKTMQKLINSVKYLSQNYSNYKLIIWDAYRPQVAASWASRNVKNSVNSHIPARDGDKNKSWFSSDSKHSKGGALDVGLANASGSPICMLNKKNFGTAWGQATGGMDEFIYSKKAHCQGNSNYAIYCKIMSAGGFTATLDGEYWHWESGYKESNGSQNY